MLVSVSWLSDYMWCARKLFLTRVLSVREPFQQAPVKGTVQHMMHERLGRIDEEIIKGISAGDKLEAVDARFAGAYAKALWDVISANKYELKEAKVEKMEFMQQLLPIFNYYGSQKAADIMNFIKTNKVYGDELLSMLPKTFSEIMLSSEKLGLKGKVDRIEQNNGIYVPVELKSGAVPKEGVWDGHRIQVGAYAMLSEEKFGVPINEGAVVYLNGFERRNVVLNPFLREEVFSIRNKVCSLIRGNKAPEIDCKGACAKCALKNICFDESFVQKMIDRKL